MTNRQDALAALKLGYAATPGDVKKRFRELVKNVHPDTIGITYDEGFRELVKLRDAALAAIEREPIRCATCEGKGTVSTFDGWTSLASTCPTCRGSGK